MHLIALAADSGEREGSVGNGRGIGYAHAQWEVGAPGMREKGTEPLA